MPSITLYDFPHSGNCYKVRLLLSMMNKEYTSTVVDLRGGETKSEAFLKINPRGHVPTLLDGDDVIWDSMAILCYLARQYGDESLFPLEPLALANVMQWLALSENELLYGLAYARAHLVLGRDVNLAQCQEQAHAGLNVMNKQLSNHKWLATNNPTIADVACYPYISLADQGKVSLETYPQVQRWMKDFEALPGWVKMHD